MLKSSFGKSDFGKLYLALYDDELSPNHLGVIIDHHLKLGKYINAAWKSFFRAYH